MSNASSQSPADEPIFLTVEQVAQRLYVGRSTAYNMVTDGEIPSVRIRNLIRIPIKEFENYLAGKLAENKK